MQALQAATEAASRLLKEYHQSSTDKTSVQKSVDIYKAALSVMGEGGETVDKEILLASCQKAADANGNILADQLPNVLARIPVISPPPPSPPNPLWGPNSIPTYLPPFSIT